MGRFLLTLVGQCHTHAQHRSSCHSSTCRCDGRPIQRSRLSLVKTAAVPEIGLGAAQAGMPGLDREGKAATPL